MMQTTTTTTDVVAVAARQRKRDRRGGDVGEGCGGINSHWLKFVVMRVWHLLMWCSSVLNGWLCASSFTPSSLHNTEKDVCVAHFRIHINVRTYNQSAEIFVQIIYQTLMYVTNSPTMDSMGTGVRRIQVEEEVQDGRATK